MAEVAQARAGGHAEPPARTANRLHQYRQRVTAARHTKQVLRALAGHIQAMFAHHSLADAKEIADNLAKAAEDERRRHCGTGDDVPR